MENILETWIRQTTSTSLWDSMNSWTALILLELSLAFSCFLLKTWTLNKVEAALIVHVLHCSMISWYLGPTGLSTLRYPHVICGDPDGVELPELLHGLETPGEEGPGAQGRQVLQRDSLAATPGQDQPCDMGTAGLSHLLNISHSSLS